MLDNFVSRQVNGLADKNDIAVKFDEHFAEECSPNCDLRNAQLKAEYEAMRPKYVDLLYSYDHAFDVELVDKIITELKKNKAAGLDNLTAEHLQFNHPIVVSVICKIFNIVMSYGYVPASFGRSYTIPLPKGNAILGKTLMVDNLGAYLLAQCCRKSSNIAYLIGFPVFWPLRIINLTLS